MDLRGPTSKGRGAARVGKGKKGGSEGKKKKGRD